MKAIIGIIICIASVFVGIYLGAWVCFVGGIVQFLEAVKSDPINTVGIAVGILRFFSASLVGWISLVITFAIGQSLLK